MAPTHHTDTESLEFGFLRQFSSIKDSVDAIEKRVREVEQQVVSMQATTTSVERDRCQPRGQRLAVLEKIINEFNTQLALINSKLEDASKRETSKSNLWAGIVAALVSGIIGALLGYLRG